MSSDAVVEEFFCIDCGYPMDDVVSFEERIPCPRCGCKARRGTVIHGISIGFSTTHFIKAFNEEKRPKKSGRSRKPYYEEYERDEFFHDGGYRQRVFRMFDYTNDRYYEQIANRSTGEVVKENDEPLSEHTNHGSAKRCSK